ncbi:MAG TPA: hypothetical protein VG605_01970 [Puia sp.]|nr:hypothetical protein [Puia sp.]
MKRLVDDLVFREAFCKHFKNLCLFAMGIIKDPGDANAIVSEVFMELRDKGVDFAEKKITSLLYISVKHDCIDYLRKRTRDKRNILRYSLECQTIEEDPLMTVAMVDEMIWDGISLGMAKLTRKQRIILINHFLLDIPAKDLAVQLGIKLSSLYTTKNKGVRGLYKFLKKNRSIDSKTGIHLRSIIKHPDNNSTQQYEV